MKLSRDAWLAIGLFIILLIVTVAAAIQQTQQQIASPYSTLSASPDGTKALLLWMKDLGYSVDEEPLFTFRLPAEFDLVFMLEPLPGVTSEEWEILDDWVEAGGTLVLAGDNFGTALAARHYRFNLSYFDAISTTLKAQTPLFASPPLDQAQFQLRAYLQSDRNDFVTHLGVDSGPVMVSFEQGEGRVILSSAPYSFSNAGLKEKGNPALVLNTISVVDSVENIWFDEWHHGLRAYNTEIVGPGNWLRYTPAGHAMIFIATVIFVALALRGLRFGRPVPLPQDITRRRSLEYVTAVANLSRRAGHRSAVLQQYRHWLKRGLGHRYRLNPTLPDPEYLKELKQLNPNFDTDALRNLLAQLNRKNVSESDMIQISAGVADWLKEK